MDIRGAVKTSLVLQDELNKLVDPEWKTRGRNWELAMAVELAETVEHNTYKWWKKQGPDQDQAFIEIVDLYHFALSRAIELNVQDLEIFSRLNDGFKEGQDNYKGQWDRDQINHALMHALHEVTAPSARIAVGGVVDVTKQNCLRFMQTIGFLTAIMGRGLEDLLTQYVMKNMTNIARQKLGYADGTYIKLWGPDKREDNEVVLDIVKNNPELVADKDRLLDTIISTYHEMTAA